MRHRGRHRSTEYHRDIRKDGEDGDEKELGDIYTPDLDVNPSEDRGIKGLHAVFGVRFAVRWSSGCQEPGKTELF